MIFKSLLLFTLLFISSRCFGQFTEEVKLSKNNYGPERIENVDFDQDGDLDIVIAVQTMGKIGWYENLGGGIFSDEKYVVFGNNGGMYDFNVGDVDQDGDFDVVMPSKSLHKIFWFENDGAMNFPNVHLISSSVSTPYNSELIDLDGDFDLDVISTSTGDDKIAWYENLGSGVFGPQQILSTSTTNPDDVRAADMDNDGDNDIVVLVPSDGKIYLFQNLGGGAFASQQQIASTIQNLAEVKLQDMDGDNLKDIIYAFQGGSVSLPSGGVAWCKNMGSNSFQAPTIINSNPIVARTLEVGDFDNDLDLDVICGNNAVSNTGNYDSLIVYLNDGNQNFSIADVASFYAGGVSYPTSISVGDLNGDGVMDVSTCSSGSTINRAVWHEHLGGGLLGPENHLFDEINGPTNTAYKDMNQDGLPDFVVLSSNDEKISWYGNSGNGNYTNQQLIGYTPGLKPYDMAIEDFNGDGDLDVVVCGHYKDIYHFENLGAGVFAPGVVIGPDSLRSHDIHVADINGDGFNDFILASRTDNELAWYQSFGNGTFGGRNVITNTAVGVENIWCEDIDNDGDVDVIAAEYLGNKVSCWLNDGSGNFTTSSVIGGLIKANGLTIADLDNDGLPDILSSSEYLGVLVWYRNFGNGNFSDTKYIDTDTFEPGDVRAADLDNDGDLDVVSISSDPYTFQSLNWYENLGGGQFALASKIVDSTYDGSSICIEDFDLDGDMDIAYTSYYQDLLSYVYNNNVANRQVKGRLFIDVNQSSTYDTADISFAQIGINSSPVSSNQYVYADGRYYIILEDTTVYTIFPGTMTNWGIFTDSASYTIDANTSFVFEDSLDFGFYPVNFIDSIELDGVGGLPRCNDTINYWINYENLGTTLPSGIISIQLDDSLTFVDAAITPDSIVGNTVYWSYDSLMYFSSEQINLFVQMPDFNSIGDTLESLIQLHVLDGLGNIVYTITDSLVQENICAYDPNDKNAEPAGSDVPGFIDPNTPYLDYTIRFQNTGNDTASVVIIEDQLDASLDWNSLEIRSSSHSMSHAVNPTGKVIFNFNNINLPDSTIDFLGSQGYVKFRIDLLSGLPPGTQITNNANIYFDLNPAIVTNTKLNTLYNCADIFNGLPVTTMCSNENLMFAPSLSTTMLDWNLTGVSSGSGHEINWQPDTSGTFSMTISADNAFCSADSTFDLTIYPAAPLNMLDTITICYGESVSIFSQMQDTSGVYTQVFTSANGCDSVLAKTLVVLPQVPVNVIDTIQICPGDSIALFGNYQSQAGLYQNTVQNIFGCDSTNAFLIELFPNYSNLPAIIMNICSGDSALVFGSYETNQGLYSQQYSSQNGCDSLVQIQLNVLPVIPSNVIDTLDICSGDSTLIFGSYETDQGMYDQLYSSVYGCDSVVQILLNVHSIPTVLFGTVGTDSLCVNHAPVTLTGGTPIGGMYSGTGVTGSSFDPDLAGIGEHYLSYTYQDTNGCIGVDSLQMVVDGCAGLPELETYTMTVYPNPFTSESRIEFGRHLAGDFSIEMINVMGQSVRTVASVEGDHLTLKRKDLSPGIYLLKLIDGNMDRIVAVERLVIY